MHAPSSLRSQQPSKSSLKTYGSRGKRASTSATTSANTVSNTRQFSWERLENERKARIEKARAHRAYQVELANSVAADADLKSELYSDPESADEVPNMQLQAVLVPQDGPARQNSLTDLAPGNILSAAHEVQTEAGSWSGAGPSAIPQVQNSAATTGHPSLSSSISSSTVAPGACRKVMFQEKTLFAEADEEEDQDEVDSEVLFRTPSFHILQKLKQMPKPRFIVEPRVNPFGFESSSAPKSETADSSVIVKVSADLPELSTAGLASSLATTTTARNRFLDSPTTKKSMDILNKRAQQLVDIQNNRKSNISTVPAVSSHGLGTEAGQCHSMELPKVQSKVNSRSLQHISNEGYDDPPRRQYTPTPQSSRETTPDPEVGRNQAIQDDCVDLALGKRISDIQITPKRLLAKQRIMAAHKSPSVPPPPPSFLDLIEAYDPLNVAPPEPLKLSLDRDIPDDENDQFDELFIHARQSRPTLLTTPLRSSRPLQSKKGSLLVHSPVRNSDPRSMSTLTAPARLQRPRFERRSPTKQMSPLNSTLPSLRPNVLDSVPNPFYDNSNLLGREPTQPKPVQQKLSPFKQTLTPASYVPKLQQLQPQPQPKQQQQPGGNMPPVRPIRQVRSLKRPPAVLVNSRKSVFRPTVDDLLSICDQRFFTQFQNPDRNDDTTVRRRYQVAEGNDPKGILDFDSLLPECLALSLTKIGEASYSEVYTVELPIQQRRRQKQAQQNPVLHYKDEDDFALFQSPKLNDYVRELSEDNLVNARNSVDDGNGSSTRLVMKVMPFFDDQIGSTAGGAVVEQRSCRTKGKASNKAESTMLALEDVYRECMVSTQIMHGWKGFIGSFGEIIVKGRYPKTFLAEWDKFRRGNGTESVRPDVYAREQLYCVILLPYGGIDLEHCPLSNWQQAWSVLAQLAASLESKEQAPFWFEHRDLHWGNILVKGTRQEQLIFSKREPSDRAAVTNGASIGTDADGLEYKNNKISRIIPTCGILVQMIDFTLARVQGHKGNLIYMDLEKDLDLFRGEGDYQFDIYRKMRKQWLHYVADKLLTEKDLAKPRSKSKSFSSRVKDTDEDDQQQIMEMWCYERVLAVSRMNLDRLDLSGQTPSAGVIDLLFRDQP
ncbi:hypothetical protein BGZ54_008044 [Gamsiella multidivaricata]|nr:hypothetical protein BGZ54_008044 [Gamsiella multidivaricata]